jgi:hypothetical protein
MGFQHPPCRLACLPLHRYKELAGPNISVMTVPEAIEASDVVLLAVPGANSDEGIKAIASSLGPGVKGKVGFTDGHNHRFHQSKHCRRCIRPRALRMPHGHFSDDDAPPLLFTRSLWMLPIP